jgi:hypothetical protein
MLGVAAGLLLLVGAGVGIAVALTGGGKKHAAGTLPPTTPATGGYSFFPRDFPGTWSGVFTHDENLGKDVALTVAWQQPADTAPGSAAIPDYSCTGEVTYQRVDGDTWVFALTWPPGRCAWSNGRNENAATLRLSPVDPQTLYFRWDDEQGRPLFTGQLHRG